MASHRYWRARNLEAYAAGALELSEFHLLDRTTRVDGSATLTASIAPTTGSLANLKDDDRSTSAVWSSPKGLVLNWDFGSDTEVTDIRLGSSDSPNTFLLTAFLEYSDDGIDYFRSADFVGITYPGERSATLSPYGPALWSITDRGPSTSVSTNRLVATCSLSNSVRVDAPKASGVWQIEMSASKATSTGSLIGVSRSDTTSSVYPGGVVGGYGYYSVNGEMYSVPVSTVVGVPYGAAFTASDVMGIVLDFDNSLLTFYKNGVSQGSISVALSGASWCPAVGSDTNTGVTNTATLRTTLLYPVAGADQWVSDTIALNLVKGRVTSLDISLVASDAAAFPYSGTILQERLRARTDFLLGGSGRISGTVKEIGTPGVPVRRRVRLIRERDGLLVQEQWSDKTTGAYDFQWVQTDTTYTVLSYDHLGNYRAVVADRLEPEAMP